MILFGPLEQLRALDRTSPQFHEKLSDFFRGDEYRGVFPKLKSEDLEWLADYLDSVGFQTIFLRSTLSIGTGSRQYSRTHKPRVPVILARTQEDSWCRESATEVVCTSRVPSWTRG